MWQGYLLVVIVVVVVVVVVVVIIIIVNVYFYDDSQEQTNFHFSELTTYCSTLSSFMKEKNLNI